MSAGDYIVHVHGDRPHATSRWSKVYRSLPIASGQRTRMLEYSREHGGNWKGDIFEIIATVASGNATMRRIDLP